MSLDKSQIVVPSRTTVYLGATGLTLPEDPAAIPPSPWFNVGHTTEDSLTFETQPEFDQVTSAQSDFPVKKFQIRDAATLQVDLEQWNGANFRAVFGGGTITEITPSTNPKRWKFVPPRLGEREEVSALVHVVEGAKNYMYIIPFGQQTQGLSQTLGKGKNSILPLRLEVIGGDNTDAWWMITDDQSFAV